jgi:hypothetical protein
MCAGISMAAATAVLIAGCSGHQEGNTARPESQVPTTVAPSSEPPVEETTPAEPVTPEPDSNFSPAEQAYVDAQADVYDGDAEIALEIGRENCAALTEYRGDALVAYLIEQTEIQWDEPAIRYLCPSARSALAAAKRGFGDGSYTVTKKVTDSLRQMRPGTYETMPGARDCYWSRLTRGGSIIRNAFIDFAPGPVRVTIKASDGGFKSDGCTAWLRRK